jgi:hypothetical protein
VKANAKAVAETVVQRSKLLGEMAHKGDLVVTPACYDLDRGKVEFMEPAGVAAAPPAGRGR